MWKLIDWVSCAVALVVFPLAAFFVFGALAAWVTFRGLWGARDDRQEPS